MLEAGVAPSAPVGGLSGDQGLEYFGRFGVDETLVRGALEAALSRGADWVELYFEHSVHQQLGLDDGAVDRASLSVSLGVGVRVLKGDQTGYAYTEELTPGSVARAASSAALIADGPARPMTAAFEVRCYPARYDAELPWEGVRVEQKMPVVSQANEKAFARDSRIARVRVGLMDSSSAVLIIDSGGHVSFDRQPMATLSLSCTAEAGGERHSASHSIAGRAGFELLSAGQVDRLAERAVERTLFLIDARPAPAGELPLVLAAGSSGILLHEAIGHGMEADFNRKGTSIYSDRMGTRIAPEAVSIVDDGTWAGARGAISVDDEGTEGQRTVLVENGVLRSYMHDRISAAHYGVEATGNGRRQSFRHVPLPRMRSTYMLAGPHDPEEILRSVSRGIYAESFTNGQVAIGRGDFTFYVKTGYLIEDGRLTQPIKDTNIIGNGPECLERVEMVGSDFQLDDAGWTCGKDGQGVPVSLGMPTIKVRAITVGGAS